MCGEGHLKGPRVFELPVAGFERILCPQSVSRGSLPLGDAVEESGCAEGPQGAGDGGHIPVLTACLVLLFPKDPQLPGHLQGLQRVST